MAAHRIIDDGTLVNVETDESIISQVPQDPVVVGKRDPVILYLRLVGKAVRKLI